MVMRDRWSESGLNSDRVRIYRSNRPKTLASTSKYILNPTLEGGGGGRVVETMEYLFLDERDWVPLGNEGSSEV